MRRTTKLKTLFVIFSLTFIFTAFQHATAQSKKPKQSAQQKRQTQIQPEINFTVAMSKPWTHLLEVEMRLKSSARKPSKTSAPATEIVMPVWTPGSYLVRDYARHVLDFTAKDQNGNVLAWEKSNKNTWRIDQKNAAEIVVTYRVYANELTVRTNELNDEHAFFTPAALLMHPKDLINAPSIVRVAPYQNWRVATGLEPLAGQANVFRAENFDVLYDSPFEVGDFKETSFDVRGVPHRIVVEGDGNYDLERLKQDVPKIVEEAVKIFGEIPYKNYLFIVNTRGGGGLEHLNSTALQWNRFGFTGARYTGFLTLVAHEYFHLWNVKRIRPDSLGPFDYSAENYTKNLWVAEGMTSYYESILTRRAGFITDKEYLADRAGQIAALQNRPGRFQTSVEEASFDAWIKNYRPDEFSINREISYYDKGEIVSMLLDLTIRQRTNGTSSLDDVMRYLYNEFYKRNRNYTPTDFQRAAETVTGASLEDFFRRYVSGRDEIDFNQAFAPFGLRLETAVPNALPAAFLGAEFRQQNEFLIVAATPTGTPAYENGLNTGDQILALNGYRILSANDLNAKLAERKPNDKVRFTVFRFDRVREIEITLGARQPESYRFVAAPDADAVQKQLYQNWLGAELK